MVEATVQAAGFVGTGFLRRSGRNRRLCGGAPLTAGGHLAVVCFGVGAGAEGTEGSLERADPGIRTMTESPAASALGEADAFLGGGDDEAVPAIHERLSDEVLHGETAAGVVDIEPHRPRIRGARVSREAGRVTFIQMDRAAEGGFHEDFLEGRPWNREEMSVITPGGFQPMIREVTDFEARFGGGNLASQLAVRSLLHVSEEGLEDLQIVGVRDGGGLQG